MDCIGPGLLSCASVGRDAGRVILGGRFPPAVFDLFDLTEWMEAFRLGAALEKRVVSKKPWPCNRAIHTQHY